MSPKNNPTFKEVAYQFDVVDLTGLNGLPDMRNGDQLLWDADEQLVQVVREGAAIFVALRLKNGKGFGWVVMDTSGGNANA